MVQVLRLQLVDAAVASPSRGREQQPSLLDPHDSDVLDRFTLVTIPVAAERLGVSRSKLYELIADGELPTVRIDRARRIAVRDLRTFVEMRRTFR